jgi:tRNA dimethylallyltransferase
MDEILDAGRVPLLAGGTMMYFRALTDGIADMPPAHPDIRDAIDADARELGWPGMHERLRHIDPVAAARIKPNDRQRIQRALEVYLASGRALSDWQSETSAAAPEVGFVKAGLEIPHRQGLHERIERRLDQMLEQGFLDEVRGLMERPGLDRDAPAMRAVGYRQIWAHLAGECTLEEGRYRALVATRQLAKRQITWLRSESSLNRFNPLEEGTIDAISSFLCDTIFQRFG